MKTCPDCKKINDDSSSYCIGCGSALAKQAKPRSFRNFIIAISLIFSVVLMGLIVLFFLTSGGLLDIFRPQAAGSPQDAGKEDTFREGLYNASYDQKKILSTFGYPDQFMVLFDEGDGNKRIDSWMYADMEACFLFEDGVYVDSSDYMVDDAGTGKYDIRPCDFVYGMAPSEVEEVLEEEGRESLEQSTGLKLLIFGDGEVICIFNDMDRLIGISKNILKGDAL